ncbi:hypothetical protein N431DRAFT_226243 [Stipitochalara longipes BDJ]|nr:hypothetical protein N431DRAFT_226243 [Stipitochalara longipes BDJ]
MNLRRYIYRLLRIRQSSVVPAVCYAVCNNAYIEAQKAGKTPALCAAGSAFLADVGQCQDCIVAHGDSTNASLTTYVDPEFAPFLDFCANSTTNSSGSSLISSQLSVLSVAATIQAALSSKASEGSLSIVTQISTVVSVSILTVQEPSATSTSNPTASPNPTPHPSSKAWIAGAVIGPVLFAFAIVLALFFYRSRNRKRNEPITATDDAEKKDDKAQLHGDSIATKYHELEGERSPELVWELPSLEPVGTELQGRKHDQPERSEAEQSSVQLSPATPGPLHD